MAISDSMCDNMLGSDENKLNSVQGKKTTDVDQHSVDTVEMCKKLLLEFRQYAKESLARISIIEEAMIKNGTLSHHMNKSKAAETFEKSRMFGKSNRLPITNDVDFSEFEKNLEDEEFKNVAVSLEKYFCFKYFL